MDPPRPWATVLPRKKPSGLNLSFLSKCSGYESTPFGLPQYFWYYSSEEDNKPEATKYKPWQRLSSASGVSRIKFY